MTYIIVARRGKQSRVISRYKNRNLMHLSTRAKADKLLKDYKTLSKKMGYSTKGIKFTIKKK